MLLLLDVGNSNIVLGLAGAGRVTRSWRVPTPPPGAGTPGLEAALREPLSAAGAVARPAGGLSAAAAACVVPALAPALRAWAEQALLCPARFAGETLPVPLAVRYWPPLSVGVDRLLNALAARELYGAPGEPLVVVDFGTATTYDAVAADGAFVGGAIAPGIGISLAALREAAPHLPAVPLSAPARALGDSTVACLQSGAYFGAVAQVEGMVRRLREELGGRARVVATGGLASVIAPGAPCLERVDPHLTLEGLRLSWERRAA